MREGQEAEVPAYAVGRRVSCGGERATVQYVGPVPPTAGLWLGVEWDNPERGKHDGSHEGVQYFTCRHPAGGSFIRPGKASFGVEYLTALQQVYNSDMEAVRNQEISLSSKKLEWFAEGCSFENLPSVILTGCEVNGPGTDGEIRKATPNVQLLDLSGSLLSCWEDVAAFTQQMNQLEELQLSCNRLTLPSEPSAHSQAFLRLKILVLNKCELTWPQILDCAPMWPQLEDLYLEENKITELLRPEEVLQNLKSLNLSMNPLEETSILGLAALPRLEQLNLCKTGLSVIHFEDAALGSQTAMFPALKNLYLDHNSISEWRVVDELAKLSALVRLSCRGNQLMSSAKSPQTAEQILIAKLGRLLILNGSKIKPEDRRGAELDYIKMFGEEWLEAGGQSQSGTHFTFQHPRYQTLINKYGAPEEGELKKSEPFALKNQLLKISFVFPDDSERKPLEKKLPISMVLLKVKGLLYRLLKVPAADLRLTYTSSKNRGTEFEMDNDLKTLQFYSIEDGDQVLVRWS